MTDDKQETIKYQAELLAKAYDKITEAYDKLAELKKQLVTARAEIAPLKNVRPVIVTGHSHAAVSMLCPVCKVSRDRIVTEKTIACVQCGHIFITFLPLGG